VLGACKITPVGLLPSNKGSSRARREKTAAKLPPDDIPEIINPLEVEARIAF
jgi:hypothetical protein